MLKTLSLKQVLTSIIGTLLLTIVLGLSLISFYTFQNYNYDEAVKFRKQQGASVSEQIDLYVSSIEQKLAMIADAMHLKEGRLVNESAIVKLLASLNKFADGTATYVVFEDGSTLEHTGDKLSDINLNEDWYTGPKTRQRFLLTKPSLDQVTGKLLSSLVVPVNIDGQFIGVIGVDITAKIWNDLAISNVPDSQIFITESSNNIVYAPYPDFLGKDFFTLRPMYRNFPASHLQYRLEDGREFVATKSQSSRYGLSVYTYEKLDVILAPSQAMLSTLLWSALAAIVASLSALYVVILKLIYTPIGGEPKQIQAIISRIAQGDLTVEAHSSHHDSGIYAATSTMLERLRHMVSGINTESVNVEKTSKELSCLVEETRQSSDKQIQQMEMTATAMNEMVSTVEEISRNAQYASSSATDAFDQAKHSASITEQTAEVMNALGHDINSVSQTIESLRNQTVNVGDVLSVIGDIADQTNLLALNAAIEAARAGEQGRGFAVVADEVRSLASRTQESIEQINQTIEQLQHVATDAVKSMTNNQGNTQEAITMATDAREALNAVLHSVGQIQDMNTQIATAAEEQNAVVQEINQSVIEVNDLAKVTNFNAESTERSTQKLSSVVENLTDITGKFKLSNSSF